ncbi:MAG TPA: T9SS type A sorting domain-containing protein [Puia sp.]|nr:T9SS type A sorting domain-containing protein [Puia sp.]
MKKLYSLTTLSLALTLLINGASAQTYTSTYTAVRNGSWHTASGVNVWDPNGEPSNDCKNCKIVINPGITITLNADVLLEQSSTLIIGTASSSDAAAVLSVAGSTGTNWSTAYNVIIMNDGSSPQNSLVIGSSSSMVDATGISSQFDGVFTAYSSLGVTSYYKQVGKGAIAFNQTTATNTGTGNQAPATLTGPVSLTADGTLPIVLLEFTATLNNKEVDLAWTTAQESNSDHFAIQRSANAGSSWQAIGTVAAKGNSSVATNYSFTDANAPSGTSEYRLQAVDKDGKYTYSEIRTTRNGLIGSVSVFPNPAKDYVNITLGSSSTATGNLSIRLINQAGQLLVDKKVTNAGGTTVSLPVSSYPPGNYLIQVTGQDGTRQISKVLISRQ